MLQAVKFCLLLICP